MKNFLLLLVMIVMAFSGFAFAQDGEVPSNIEPVLNLLKYAIQFLNSTFPKAGPIIQLVMEIIASVGTFFTVSVVFVKGLLTIPMVAAKWAGSAKWMDKIQKFHDKIIPILKYFSIFNTPKVK